MDKVVDIVNNLTINDAKYFESKTGTASDALCDLTRKPEIVTHTRIGNKTVTHTINKIFEHKLLSNRTIPVLPPAINLGIDKIIVTTVLAP